MFVLCATGNECVHNNNIKESGYHKRLQSNWKRKIRDEYYLEFQWVWRIQFGNQARIHLWHSISNKKRHMQTTRWTGCLGGACSEPFRVWTIGSTGKQSSDYTACTQNRQQSTISYIWRNPVFPRHCSHFTLWSGIAICKLRKIHDSSMVSCFPYSVREMQLQREIPLQTNYSICGGTMATIRLQSFSWFWTGECDAYVQIKSLFFCLWRFMTRFDCGW